MTARADLFHLVEQVAGARDACWKDKKELNLGRARELALSGYVILADWIASNQTLFPPLIENEHSEFLYDNYRTKSEELASKALKGIGWSRPSFGPEKSGDWFHERFGFKANSIQDCAIGSVKKSEQAMLVLIEAPMGAGKTEAALAAAELMAAKLGLNGLFIGLPTQATSNQMFHRTLEWLTRLKTQQDTGDSFVVELAHGKARQQKQYQELQNQEPSCVGIDEGDDAPRISAEAWFAGSKRRLLAPIVVGTVDQVLLCAAQVRHVALREVGLLGKVVVIDEVHAYDAYMSVFLCQALRWLAASQIPVILLSATLPPGVRSELLKAYAGDQLDVPSEVSYPAVTTVALGDSESASTAVSWESSKKTVKLEWLADQDLVTRCAEMADKGANVLVIRNTVHEAQQTHKKLKLRGAVKLLHSRFTAADRLELEELVTEKFGRNAADRPKGMIVIGTQVLEQSLDVDFDVLVTDLAPIDLVLQRSGRVHRHEHIERPKGFEQPRVLVTGVGELTDGGSPELASGSVAVYGPHLLLRTAAVLKDREELTFPTDLPELVAAVYSEQVLGPEGWSEAAAGFESEWTAQQDKRHGDASQWVIREPNVGSLSGLCQFGIETRDDDSPILQALVRDAPETVEVAVSLGAPNTRCWSGTEDLDAVQVDAVLSSVVRLPPSLTEVAKKELQIPPAFARHPWLRNLRLLQLKADSLGSLTRQLGGKTLTYSAELGLEVAIAPRII